MNFHKTALFLIYVLLTYKFIISAPSGYFILIFMKFMFLKLLNEFFFPESCNNVIKKNSMEKCLVSSFKRDNQTVGDFFLIIKKIYFQELKALFYFIQEV